ncbi:MAG: putative rane protein [Oscillospiraceae bacterium]|jgi:uncharacterized membrane protein YesL|nr:putative rane protein [Oscillospiraceae bacterium]
MANIFQITNFSKAGPGIDKNGPTKKRFFLFFDIFFRKFWKLILLNLLYIAFCIPIVTIGPATAGFVYVLRNFSEEKHAFLWGDFIGAFKRNWKQSVGMTVINVLIVIILSVAIPFYYDWLNQSRSNFFYIPLGLCIFVAIAALFMNYYSYLMIVSLDLKLKQIIKNSLILSIACLKTNLLTTLFIALIAAPLYLFYMFAFPIILGIGISMIGLIICFNSYRHILKYVVEPFYKKQNENQPDLDESPDEAIFKDIGTQEVAVEIKNEKIKKNRTIK